MGLFSMLVRSVLSYTVFLASRKIVRGGIGAGQGLKKSLKLHRCENCWRLYSGEITSCTFCGTDVVALYSEYEEDDYGPYNNSNQFDKREGLERQIYNDTQGVKFEPLKAPRTGMNNDRYSRRNGTKSGRGNQRRNSNSPRHSHDNRERGYSNSNRNKKLG
jgi:hypothetical protein